MSSSDSAWILAVGELVVDLISTRLGDTIEEARSFERLVGGNATNVAVNLARLGTPVRLVGTIGRDINGNFLLTQLQKESVDLRFVEALAAFPTAQCYAVRNHLDEPSYYNWPRPHAGDMLTVENLPDEIFAQVRFMHCTGISLVMNPRRQSVLQLMQKAQSLGVLVCFDATVAGDVDSSVNKAAESAIQYADIVKVNRQELAFWLQDERACEPDSLSASAEKMLTRFGLDAVAVTMGSDGAFVRSRTTECSAPALHTASVCSIGAGDAFIAGLLHQLNLMPGEIGRDNTFDSIKATDWQKILTFANAAGALSTRGLGALDALISEKDVSELIESSERLAGQPYKL